MNINIIAKQWLIDHGHSELDFNFQKDVEDLIKLITDMANNKDVSEHNYDPNFGDDKLCLCGHSYYRHFDTYDNMSSVGCKYCTGYGDYDESGYGQGNCAEFKLAPEHKKDCQCKSCIGM